MLLAAVFGLLAFALVRFLAGRRCAWLLSRWRIGTALRRRRATRIARLRTIGRIPRDLVIPLLFGVGATVLLLATFPMELLVVVALGYLASIPFSIKRYRALAAADAPPAPEAPGAAGST